MLLFLSMSLSSLNLIFFSRVFETKWKKLSDYGILMRMRNEQSTGEESYEKISSSADPDSSDHDDRMSGQQTRVEAGSIKNRRSESGI